MVRIVGCLRKVTHAPGPRATATLDTHVWDLGDERGFALGVLVFDRLCKHLESKEVVGQTFLVEAQITPSHEEGNPFIKATALKPLPMGTRPIANREHPVPLCPLNEASLFLNNLSFLDDIASGMLYQATAPHGLMGVEVPDGPQLPEGLNALISGQLVRRADRDTFRLRLLARRIITMDGVTLEFLPKTQPPALNLAPTLPEAIIPAGIVPIPFIPEVDHADFQSANQPKTTP